MINPGMIMKLKGAWDRFTTNHPKIEPFLQAAGNNIEEGSIIEIAITNAHGEKITTNMKLTSSDMDLFSSIKEGF